MVRLRGRIDGRAERLALRAALAASHLLGLATGTHLRQLRNLKDPITQLQSRLEEAELRARLAWEIVEILSSRFAKIPERHRPYFTAAQRFRVLELRSLLVWSAQEAARVFLVCPNTILNWERTADPMAHCVGSCVKPTPPVRRAADVVRSLTALMTRLGFGGQDLVSRILARAGWTVSARAVGRYRKERPVPVDPESGAGITAHRAGPVVARFVNHAWMMDVSQVRQFLGPDLYLAAVFDAFSRVPLAIQTSETKPAAPDMARLLRAAARAFAEPKYVITDRGGEFTGRSFARCVRRLGAVQRFAATESLFATARLERFWRTLKESCRLCRLQLPLTVDDLELRLKPALVHYLCFRPHEGLKGATPMEALLGLDPAHHAAVEPPRGRPGEGPRTASFQVEYLEARTERFPILKPAA